MPFCHLCLTAARPLPRSYPQVLAIIGDHLRRRRLDLGLRQREVAYRLGVDTTTVTNWELNRTTPAIRSVPGIILFLGYLPFAAPGSIVQQLTVTRTVRGLSRQAAARILDVDPATLWRWESEQRMPGAAFLARIEAFLGLVAE
ncbi:MAG: helix-turn-helix domain-containing protein [Gemmatimonadales bacterium]